MADCESCPSNGYKCDTKDTCSIENNPLNSVKNIIRCHEWKRWCR